MVRRNAVTKTTMAGEADPEFDFAKNASNNHKLIWAWNDMCEMTVRFLVWMHSVYDTYKPFSGDNVGRNTRSITKRINRFGI
jgi:hypothetical protein